MIAELEPWFPRAADEELVDRALGAAISAHAAELAGQLEAAAVGRTLGEASAAVVARLAATPIDRAHAAAIVGDWVRAGERAARAGVALLALVQAAGGTRIAVEHVLGRELAAAPERLARALPALGRRLDGALAALVHGHQQVAGPVPVATLAHELRNPLTAVVLDLQLLARRARDGERDEAMRAIERVTGEVLRLGRVLERARDASSPQVVAIGLHDLAAVVRHVIERERPVAAAAGVRLSLREPVAPPVIECDRDRLHQIVLNVVRNAIEAATTRVSVDVSELVDGAAITVRDDGPGFPAEMLAPLGRPFATTKPGGTGLGLAICRRLVALHGGRLRARNAGGAEVTIELPRRIA